MPELEEEADAGFYPTSNAAQRQLAAVLCKLRALIPLSQAAICSEVHIAKPTLTGYLKAGRVPDDKMLGALYELAERAAGASQAALPMTLDEVLRLAEVARARHCSGCACGGGDRAERKAVVPAQPAGPDALAAGTGALSDGDRHHSAERNPSAAVAQLARHMESGRLADARTLMQYTGSDAPVVTIADFVADSRHVGLHDAADAVLHHAARRDAPIVLELAARLLSEERVADAKLLLQVAAAGIGAA